MRRRKFFLVIILLIVVGVVATTYLCNKTIINASRGKLYSDSSVIPFNRVGLLLGTSKTGPNGNPNLYYKYRIQAALELLNAHKIKYLIISGDNGRKDYNEPGAMRSDLIKAGIDSSIIYLDYAGFRTFDSIKRLKAIFGQDSVTIISQQFHNERAIYIAERDGISAIGFNATDVSFKKGFKTQIREKLARVKVFLDFWFRKKPKYLGEKIIIPS